MSHTPTAVLFFSRTLKDEFQEKGYGLGRERFALLYELLVERSLNTIRESGLPLIELYSSHQVGESFGERLKNAVEEVASQGYQNVIVIGNDTPELTSEDLLRANEILLHGKQVIGKNRRGGAYLIGFSLDRENLNRLEKVIWKSGNVYQQLLQRFDAPIELCVKVDLNEKLDFSFLRNTSFTLSRGFKRVLLCFWKIEFKGDSYSFSQLTCFKEDFNRRGPPSVIYAQ